MDKDDTNRKRKNSDIPMCKYGLSCYRKNPEHHKKFKHPSIQRDDAEDQDDEVSSAVEGKKKCLDIKSELPELETENQDDGVSREVEENACMDIKSELPELDEESEDDGVSSAVEEKRRGIDVSESPELDAAMKDANENSLHDAPKTDQAVKPEAVSVKDMSELLNINKDKSNSIESNEETVAQILKLLPKDFFDFWKFCTTVNKSNPEDAFHGLGYKLVGLYDLLVKKFPDDQKVDISCHWRYFYDPPEFQTVIRKVGKDKFHIGYFRDDPSKLPSVLASNSGEDAKLSLKGDNIFAAMNFELEEAVKSKTLKRKATKLLKELQEFASQKKYSLKLLTDKVRQRRREVVARTFHGLGIVVPVKKNDVGYRPLPDSDSTIKSILKKIVSAENETKQLEFEEQLDEIVTNVQFANDECDYGTGLELGIDLFCFGDTYFHKHISSILPLAYILLQRQKYALIVRSHLKNRKEDSELSTIDV